VRDGRRHDLIGFRSGRLLVVRLASHRDGRVCWACQCDCGNVVAVKAKHLTQRVNPVRSCGCVMRGRDLTGAVFGRLTVVRFFGYPKVGRRQRLWLTACRCGRSHVVRGPSLLSGNTKACGFCRSGRDQTAISAPSPETAAVGR
jgi:hypothetical protein